MTGRPVGAPTSDPLDRIEALWKRREARQLLLAEDAGDVLALVAVARAARRVDKYHAFIPDPEATLALSVALARLEEPR